MDYAGRIAKLQSALDELQVDALLVTELGEAGGILPHIRYLSGFSGSNGMILVMPDSAHFFTDFRYKTQSKQEVHVCEVHVPSEYSKVYDLIREIVGEGKRIGVIGSKMTVAGFEGLKKKFSDASIAFVPVKDMIAKLRSVKEDAEIEAIRAAQELTDKLFDRILEKIRPDVMTELDLAAEIEYMMKKLGAEGYSFRTIVASGAHTAVVHAQPRNVVIKNNTPLLIDMGLRLNGYVSDMTRTLWIGSKPDLEFVKLYQIVLDAQELAEEKAKPGMTSVQIDRLARDYIEQHGYGEFFGHSLGHGVGLEVHELPRVSHSKDFETKIVENMVFTVEPGIYIEGFAGVRIEDIVVMRSDGVEVITKSPKELLTL